MREGDPNGLRSLADSLNSNRTFLYHLGISKDVKRSTISYANSTRNPEVFERLFYKILGTLDRGRRKKFRKDFFAVDATEISLSMNDFPWAEFRSTKSGVKINMKYDINNSVPDYLFITNAKEYENNTLDKMRLKRGDTVAIDKGYCNYERFGSCCDQEILFVTRLKDNARYEVVESRRVKSIDEKTGKSIVILTNDFSVSAEYIAKMYRARWNIEICFKTLKQNLEIEKFFGESENAVKAQIWIALIVYLLYLRLRQLTAFSNKNFPSFICELRVCIFDRRNLFGWFSLSPPDEKPKLSLDCIQGELGL